MFWNKTLFGPLMAPKADESGASGDEDQEDETEDQEEGTEEKDEEAEDEDEEEEGKAKGKKKTKAGDLSDTELTEAGSLYKLLKDPATRNSTLRILAEREGLLKGEETKKEIKKDAKDIKSILKETLGDKFDFLSDKLGDAIEAILKQERAESETKLSELSNKRLADEVDAGLTRLAKETGGQSRKFETKMAQLMNELTPQKGVSAYQYLKNLYTIASADAKDGNIKNRMADRIRRNANDLPGRLNNSGGNANGLKIPKRMVTSKEAVNFAAKQLGYLDDDE